MLLQTLFSFAHSFLEKKVLLWVETFHDLSQSKGDLDFFFWKIELKSSEICKV